jgi:hypothetical protein
MILIDCLARWIRKKRRMSVKVPLLKGDLGGSTLVDK